jgi:cell division protein FtsI (penicillin-binding protein 3)
MSRRASAPHRRRLYGLLAVLTLLFVAIISRVADLQLGDQERYVAYGQAQRLRSEILPATRGSVLDRAGVELALSVPSTTVWADPRSVTDPRRAAATLAPLLGLDEAWLVERFSRASRFEYLARQIDDDTADAISALALPGVHLRAEPSRAHPSGGLARTVLGSADIDGHGVSGVELQFDDLLTGTPGEVVFERSLNGGVPIPVGEQQVVPAQRGHDVALTIDASLQYLVEAALADTLVDMGAQNATAIVSVPGTGEVLAMVSLTVDPETGDATPASYNQGVVDSFAPGSVIKLVTVAASLEEGISSPGRTLSVPDQYRVANSLFTDHTPHAVEDWSVTRILVDSSNVGAIKLGQELGPERVSGYLERFGFGQPTGLGFPGESRGLVRPADEWHGSDIGGVVIGTGVSVTAAQVLAAYNVVANDGVFVPLRLVDSHIDAEGNRWPVEPGEAHRVLSEHTSRQLATMLAEVVTDGTGTRAAVPGYSVAGKTGTAWKRFDDGSFSDQAGNRRYMATFVGFAPVDDPRVSVIVVLDQPRNAYSGGGAAAPAFSAIAEHALRLLDVPPTRGAATAGAGSSLIQVSDPAAPTARVRATPAVDPRQPPDPDPGAPHDR